MVEVLEVNPEIQKQMPAKGLSPAFENGLEGFLRFLKLEATALRNKTRVILYEFGQAKSGEQTLVSAVTAAAETLFADNEEYCDFPPEGEFSLTRE